MVANVLTAVRFLLVLPIGFLMAADGERAAALAAAAIAAAIATDLLDGPLARRAGAATRFGAAFDHTTDCLFVVSALAGGVMRGVFPGILPVLVVTAFAQYVIDSYWLHGERRLRGSRLGRYNGILYFVPIGGDTLVRLGLEGLRPAVTVVCWTLVISTGVSIGQRLWALKAARQRDLASPAGGTAGRSPR
jgi:phosphatidylglycerophosphate synthase